MKTLSRLANAHVTMCNGRIPFLVLITALLPVVLGALVCSPGQLSFAEYTLSKGETAVVLQTIARAQAEQLGIEVVFPTPGTTNVAPVCLTQGADVWTVFDGGGIRDEQAMRRLVWDRYPTVDHEGNPFADQLAFQPGDSLGYDFEAVRQNGQGYVCYYVDLGRLPRHFRIWGDHWNLDVRGDGSGQYLLAIQAVSLGRPKASQVVETIKGAMYKF